MYFVGFLIAPLFYLIIFAEVLSYNGCGCAGSSTVEVTDERGKKRKTVNDHLGRLQESYNLTSAGTTVSRAAYSYTPLDQLTTIAQYDNGTVKHQDRTFAYDGYGRLTSQTTPEAGITGFTYTARDEVLTATNANARTATFTYEGRGLVTDIDYNGTDTQDVHYEYNEYGARTLMQEKNPSSGTVESSTSYSYNTYEQLQSETRVFKGLSGTYSVGYQYNLAGMLKTVTYTVNSWIKNVNYDYTYAAALKSVGTNIRAGYGSGDTTNVMNGMLYRGFGATKQANYGNGRQLTANYDAKRLQMTYMSVHSASNVNDKIVSLDYNYYNGGANNGRIQKITDYLDGAYTTTYTYDDLNRLTNANATAFTRSYGYDAWANLTNVTATGAGETGSYTLPYATNASGAPATNRINTGWHSYDTAGNNTNDGIHSYAYDAVNRLKSSDSNKFMEYDGDGRRVKNDESGAGNITLYSLWSTVLGQVVADIATGQYTYRAYVYSSSGQRLAQQGYDGQFQWIHTNHLGNGYKMTDSVGAVVFREEYDPHGQTVLRIASNGPWYLSRKFTGYERDYSTNTDYAKARQYHHNNNRFMQPDPLGLQASDLTNPQSLNLYSYVQNDPVNYVDPSGMLLAMVCWSVDWQGWNEKGESVTGSTQVCAIIDIGGGWGGGPIGPIDPPDGGGIGTGGSNGDVQVQQTQEPQNDCQTFANMVDQIAKETIGKGGNVQGFMDRLATTFTEFKSARNASVLESFTSEGRNNNFQQFQDRGFRPEFWDREPGGSINQVRHAVGGLIAGYVGIPKAIMTARERGSTPASRNADLALNDSTMPMGARIAQTGKGASLIGPAIRGGWRYALELGDWIRNNLCV